MPNIALNTFNIIHLKALFIKAYDHQLFADISRISMLSATCFAVVLDENIVLIIAIIVLSPRCKWNYFSDTG